MTVDGCSSARGRLNTGRPKKIANDPSEVFTEPIDGLVLAAESIPETGEPTFEPPDDEIESG